MFATVTPTFRTTSHHSITASVMAAVVRHSKATAIVPRMMVIVFMLASDGVVLGLSLTTSLPAEATLHEHPSEVNPRH